MLKLRTGNDLCFTALLGSALSENPGDKLLVHRVAINASVARTSTAEACLMQRLLRLLERLLLILSREQPTFATIVIAVAVLLNRQPYQLEQWSLVFGDCLVY